MNQKFNEEGLTVKDLREILKDAPDDAIVLVNHKCKIANPEDDGTYSVGWVFDPVVECQCEEIIDQERYPEWKSNDKLVWLTHHFDEAWLAEKNKKLEEEYKSKYTNC